MQCGVDPLSIPVWQNTSVPAQSQQASCRLFIPPDFSDTHAAAHTTGSALNSSLALTAKHSLSHEPARPPLCPSREHSSSSSNLFSAAGSGRPILSGCGEPRSFPVLTPPSETPLEAARTLLEGTDSFGFGAVERGGALFAPDMTPPASSTWSGADPPLAVAASAGTEAMFTPSLDTPLTKGGHVGGAARGPVAAATKAPAVHSRSLSGLLRACVVDTFGLGGGAAVSVLPAARLCCLEHKRMKKCSCVHIPGLQGLHHLWGMP